MKTFDKSSINASPFAFILLHFIITVSKVDANTNASDNIFLTSRSILGRKLVGGGGVNYTHPRQLNIDVSYNPFNASYITSCK